MTRQDTHHIKSSWIIVVHWLWIVIIELIESYDELDREWGLCWVKQTSSAIFNLECFHEECRRSCWNCWFCEPGICSSTRRSLSKPLPSLTLSWPRLPLLRRSWGCGTGGTVGTGHCGCGCLGQALSCMVTAGAPGLTLPWGCGCDGNERSGYCYITLVHAQAPLLLSELRFLFHWGSYLLLKQACNWTCISQCISQWIALHIASHVWIQTHDLTEAVSWILVCKVLHTQKMQLQKENIMRETPQYMHNPFSISLRKSWLCLPSTSAASTCTKLLQVPVAPQLHSSCAGKGQINPGSW